MTKENNDSFNFDQGMQLSHIIFWMHLRMQKGVAHFLITLVKIKSDIYIVNIFINTKQ